ncbi:phenylacetic acid degradation NADH oxidoreductase [Streptomyces albus]|uniref:Phenylacetic acid degradation NADH oxidoreductase n=1 Tax=Streptomyces albus (strain ATCC 21838 / DSM 41398 / FERM P-419 / JCM 4703 / NBRC 107858) TaxID=1081613 RepID=A0A0B5EZA4_STRA4|nr:phenylacetic acid degradation NADH oxidoreductase [Streptomyces albus]AOU78250.1 phenylacetic acid degradation NADH oxidoreductase [Streptomyces albus]AYN34003.1 phenylacetic acid degradation protein [Streptomyces albus]
MARFHPLRVAAVDRLTDDSVALTFEVPPELRAEYRHAAGQHLALRRFADGAEVRRTYSICSPAPGPEGPSTLRVGVRFIEGGSFSTYALKELQPGHEVEVMTPAGRFTLDPAPGHYAAVVGGSGITPVLSIAATLLAREPGASFCLLRSDRTAASTMFLDEVADLKDRYPDRFQLATVLSQEEQQAGLPSGRLDGERLRQVLPALLPVERIDGWFLCGPYGLVQSAETALRALGVDRTRVHQEIFHVDAAPPRVVGTGGPAHSTVTAQLDGRSGSWAVQDGESVLETVLRNRSDAPYACKGGVCGTCRTFLVSGEIRMDRNFALEPEETEAGYILACQSHPASEKVEVDFDR